MRALCAVVALSAGCSFHTSEGMPGSDHPIDGATTVTPDGTVTVPPDACSDKDNDGTCDVADAWPCGAMQPDDPGNVISLHSQMSNVAAVDLGGSGSSKVKVSTPGQSWQFNYDWGLQVDCPGGQNCRAQIEYGIAGVGRLGCLADRNVSDNQFQGALGNQAMAMMPAAPGVYEVRAKIGFSSGGCGTTASWYGGSEPDNTTTFAILCVPP